MTALLVLLSFLSADAEPPATQAEPAADGSTAPESTTVADQDEAGEDEAEEVEDGSSEPGVPPIAGIPPELLEIARESSDLPLPQRMEAISRWMMEAPYVADALGEGHGIDADPPARYDVFDCQTFLEEVLALSMAGDPAHAAWIRHQLRYGDVEATYPNRRHFMELEWIPENTAEGWVRDTTTEYGETVHFENEIGPGTWRAWGRRSLFHHTDDELPLGKMELDVLPLETAIEVVDEIRPGSIILTVREHRPWIPLWVTHVGFTVPAEEPTVRHASRMKSAMRVRDHGLKWYLEHLQTYKNWKAAGIAILEPIEQGPRRSLVEDVAIVGDPSLR